MNIDSFFSPARCWWLMKKYVMENRSTLVMTGVFTAVFMLLIALINGMSSCGNSNPASGIDAEIGFMLLAFALSGCIVASTAFKQMWNKNQATSLLMTPATAFEQTLVRWIIVGPVYTVWALVCAMAADSLKYVIFKWVLGKSAATIPWMSVLGITMPEYLMYPYALLMMYAITQSFFFLGSIVWKKNAYFKTFFVVGMLFLLYAIPSALVADSYTNRLPVDVSLPRALLSAPLQILMWLTLIINYTLTVMRLRESEIIHRW